MSTPSRRPRSLRRLALSVALLPVVLAPLLVAGPAASARPAATQRTEREHSIADAVFRHINHERALHQLRPVTMNADLVHSAHRHNLTMARFNELSHQLPGEAFFSDRILRAGYHWLWAGENIAWNSQMNRTGVVTLQQLMYHERPPNDGHRLNILNPHYRNVGVDVYLDSQHHKAWLTTDFGRHR